MYVNKQISIFIKLDYDDYGTNRAYSGRAMLIAFLVALL